MLKKLILLMIVGICVITSISPMQALENSEDIGLTSEYVAAIDAKSGMVLYNKNMNERMFPASMTKVMTVIVALEMIKDLEATTVITQSDLDTVWETGASAANFELGEVVTYRDLLLGAILPSGADATRALANNLCGGQEKFVDKMNELAKKLKLKDTHFVNTTGIHDPNHYTTAYEMALIVKYAVENETFREIYGKRYATSSNGLHQWVNKAMYNARRGNLDISSILGSKSGYTVPAKNCLSSLDKVGDNEIITIVGKANNEIKDKAAVVDTLDVINYVGSHYSMQQILTKDKKVKSLTIKAAKENGNIEVKNLADVKAFLPNNYDKDKLEYKYSFNELEAPLKKGDKLGKLNVYYDGYLLHQEEYLSNTSIERNKFADFVEGFKSFMFPYGIAIILVVIYFIVSKKKKIK